MCTQTRDYLVTHFLLESSTNLVRFKKQVQWCEHKLNPLGDYLVLVINLPKPTKVFRRSPKTRCSPTIGMRSGQLKETNAQRHRNPVQRIDLVWKPILWSQSGNRRNQLWGLKPESLPTDLRPRSQEILKRDPGVIIMSPTLTVILIHSFWEIRAYSLFRWPWSCWNKQVSCLSMTVWPEKLFSMKIYIILIFLQETEVIFASWLWNE